MYGHTIFFHSIPLDRSAILTKYPIMIDESKVLPSTIAMPAATRTNEILPTWTPNPLSGTTATSSSTGDIDLAANASTVEPSTAQTTEAAAKAKSQRQCANCDANATKHCNACVEGLDSNGDSSPPPFYCSAKCQQKHWNSTHQIQYKLAIDRRQLYRIGALIQHAFYAGTKAMWYDDILEVNKIIPVVENSSVDGREIEHARGDDSVEVRVRDFKTGISGVEVKVRKQGRVAWEDGVEVHLRRYKRHDGPDFPEFPTGHLPGYGGVLGKRSEQALLASSAANATIVCVLLDNLLKGESPTT